MIQALRHRMEAQIEKIKEMFNKDLEELQNKETVMNNAKTEIKNTLEGIDSRIIETEEWISQLEDRVVKITDTEQNKEKIMKRNEDSLRDLWKTLNAPNIRIIGVPEGEEKERGSEKIFEEIIVKNCPKWEKNRHLSPGRTESHTG